MEVIYPEEVYSNVSSDDNKLKSEERIEKAKIKSSERIKIKQMKSYGQSNRKNLSRLKAVKVQPKFLTREQGFLRTLFGEGDKVIFGSKDSESLPQINGVLRTGNGLVKSGDLNRETAHIFGF